MSFYRTHVVLEVEVVFIIISLKIYKILDALIILMLLIFLKIKKKNNERKHLSFIYYLSLFYFSVFFNTKEKFAEF
jgi:hypothetical protein